MASACILLLNRQPKYYPTFRSILVYPGAYVARQSKRDGVISVVQDELRLGESWQRGPVVLAWDHVLHGALDAKDGRNVVLHEFARKFDEADGSMDGTPILNQTSHYVSWARVMHPEFERLIKKAKKGRKTVLDHYGAASPAEFFAVLTETFFEKPKALKRKHPELYEEVRSFYQVDPLEWRDDQSHT